VFAKLLGALFGAKATAVSAALILAGALVTGTSGDAEPVLENDDPAPAPALGASLPTVVPAPARAAEPSGRPEASPAPSTAAASCAADAQTRDAALRTIGATLASSRAALDRLNSERDGARSGETLDRADTMLVNVDRAAEDLVSKVGACAADVREVSDRAVHAMEMIVDLARSATAPTPTPRVTPKPTHRRH